VDSETLPDVAGELRGPAWDALVDGAEWSRDADLAEFVARSRSSASASPELSDDGRLTVEEVEVDAADGSEALPGVIVRPVENGGGRPCLYFVAGGRVRQSPYLSLTASDAAMVAALGTVLVSVAPRVGPEHPHPAQVEDAYAGLQWITDRATELGIDPSRLLAFGKGGGGGVAAALTLLARDRGGPSVAGQVLIAPMLDDRGGTLSASYEIAPWPRRNNRLAWSAVLGDAVGGPNVSPYAAVARAEDLRGLPPTYLEVGASEVMRDEVLTFGRRLAEQGVPTELHMWGGGFHAFDAYAPDAEVSKACRRARMSYLQRRLSELSARG